MFLYLCPKMNILLTFSDHKEFNLKKKNLIETGGDVYKYHFVNNKKIALKHSILFTIYKITFLLTKQGGIIRA